MTLFTDYREWEEEPDKDRATFLEDVQRSVVSHHGIEPGYLVKIKTACYIWSEETDKLVEYYPSHHIMALDSHFDNPNPIKHFMYIGLDYHRNKYGIWNNRFRLLGGDKLFYISFDDSIDLSYDLQRYIEVI